MQKHLVNFSVGPRKIPCTKPCCMYFVCDSSERLSFNCAAVPMGSTSQHRLYHTPSKCVDGTTSGRQDGRVSMQIWFSKMVRRPSIPSSHRLLSFFMRTGGYPLICIPFVTVSLGYHIDVSSSIHLYDLHIYRLCRSSRPCRSRWRHVLPARREGPCLASSERSSRIRQCHRSWFI
jgi:hypothetical protein